MPFEERSPFVTSGIRLGTPALTTRGFKENEMRIVADLIDKALTNTENDSILKEIRNDVKSLSEGYPLHA